MSWFEHKHYWCSIRVNKLGLPYPKEARCAGEIITQQCNCGAIRTLTIEPGVKPVIRMAVEQ